jgi:CheY-like chemotaxis protein
MRPTDGPGRSVRGHSAFWEQHARTRRDTDRRAERVAASAARVATPRARTTPIGRQSSATDVTAAAAAAMTTTPAIVAAPFTAGRPDTAGIRARLWCAQRICTTVCVADRGCRSRGGGSDPRTSRRRRSRVPGRPGGRDRAREDLELVATCRDGREALERIRGEPPDVAVLDLSMPRLTAQGVLEELAATGCRAGCSCCRSISAVRPCMPA